MDRLKLKVHNPGWGIALTCLAALYSTVAGCGKSGSACTVSGRVLIEGSPLAAGTIMFVPIEGTLGGVAGGAMKNGIYAIRNGLQPGQYRVEIRQPRSSKRRIPKPFGTPGETIEGTEESIHETYNDTSTLRAVLEAGANEVDFTLRLRT